MKRIGLAGLMLVAASAAFAAVKTEVVDYKDGKVKLSGYFAYDDAKTGKLPAVMIVHEWKGLGDYAKRRADQLAEMGFLAFACDMYGKGVYAKDHEEAGKLSGAFFADRVKMRARAKAGLDRMKAHPLCDPEKIGAMGYCFGGATVLELARSGEALKGVISFHGNLKSPAPATKETLKAKILVCHGGSDSWADDGLAGFRAEMDAAGADWQLLIFGGAVHSFTVKEAGDDPSKGMAYHEKADQRSWAAMRRFWREVFDLPMGRGGQGGGGGR